MRRNIERRLERLEDGHNDLPNITLCVLFSADEIETVDKERGIARIDGELYKDGLGVGKTLEEEIL